MRYLACLFVLSLILVQSLPSEARRSRRIEVAGALEEELNNVLSGTNNLHSACISENQEEVEGALKTLIQKIEAAKEKSSLAKDQRPHLIKILDAARTQLEMTQMQNGEDRMDSLKEAFRQLVQIAQVFKLENYHIYFCDKNGALWLQESWGAKNPINTKKMRKCGKRVKN